LAADELHRRQIFMYRKRLGPGVHGGWRQDWGLAKLLIFSYACGVLRVRLFVLRGLIIVLSACYGSRALVAQTAARASSPEQFSVVTKVEPRIGGCG